MPGTPEEDVILIVDDDIDVRESLAEFLEDEGYTIHSASNGAEALDHLRASNLPCLILLDLMMPVMDGYQFRVEQMKDAALAQIPVIVVTARGFVDRSQVGAAEILHKPLDLPRLVALIQRHC